MNIINWLSSIGTKQKMDDDLKNKIRLSNYLTSAFLVIIITYSVISFFLIPEIINYCLLGFVLYAANLAFSYFGFHRLTRFGISLFPPIVIAVLHATIMQPGEPPRNEIYVFQAIACLIPFAVFDIRRLVYWLGPFLFSFLLLFYIEELNNYFNTELDSSIFDTGWLYFAIIAGAVMVGAFIIIFLKYLNLVQFKRTSELLSEIEEENKRAQEKEQELTKTLSDLEVAQKEESKRNWKTSGLAEIGNLLRVEDDLDELCDKIIAYIVKYMEASQGALFLLDDDTTKDRQEQELYIKSAYAYERKKRLDHRVQAGEGLIGQCFLEKDYIYLTEVPDSFISIKSGLGDANPRSILITPMIVNEQVYGIFEIASFKEIEQYQIDFMMELGENIAMTLNNFKVNERTKKLLEETQEQSEQLRSQEEEMRQNMEELQATQEEQERQQKEMAEKIKELEREKAQALSRLAELETD
ncbi:hypothetical protein GCM10027429_06400 [Marivirga atlantica]|jgi:hypothetical protein|uniref:GAF domain-containing protein n=1 Tax=Marivirga atlantica TaxID=1548457 RepID=A0A937A8M8_9BACT|nr:GAF domain-containing protein [Marivirga atlantica]MBL0764250.1 GAF domain-containing protein [Marivirga atlantica]